MLAQVTSRAVVGLEGALAQVEVEVADSSALLGRLGMGRRARSLNSIANQVRVC